MTKPDTNEPIVVDGRTCQVAKCDPPLDGPADQWFIADEINDWWYLRNDGIWFDWMSCTPETSQELWRFRWPTFAAAIEFASSVAASSKPAEQMNGWLPIDSAPKDGTEFLGYWDNDDMHVVCIRDGQCRRPMDNESWAMPTHWRPLPTPPVPQEQSNA